MSGGVSDAKITEVGLNTLGAGVEHVHVWWGSRFEFCLGSRQHSAADGVFHISVPALIALMFALITRAWRVSPPPHGKTSWFL